MFISPRYEGGIGGHAFMLSEQLKKQGHEVDLLHAPHLPIKNFKNPSFILTSTLQSFFNRSHYDIVHAFNVPSAFAMRYSKGTKKILSIHGVFSEQIESLHSRGLSKMTKEVESKVLDWPDALTTDSKATQKQYKKKLGYDFEYLPSPIDVSKFKTIPNVKKIENQISYVGRDSYEKGIDLLKKAEPQINGKIIYSTNLSWINAMKNLKSSELLILPSRMESSPTTVKESLYLKIPVIAADVGGVSELISNNDTGLLIPPNNIEKLIEAANMLLLNKEKAKQLSDSGYEFVKNNMTWEVVLPKYIKFYEDLLQN